MVKAVIFDMDGVLVNSQPIHYKADIFTLKDLGIAIAQSDLEKYAGTSNPNRFANFKKDFSIKQTIEQITAIQQKYIFNLIAKENLEPVSGVKHLIKALHINTKIAVASSSSYKFVNAVLNKIGIINFFDEIVSGEDMINSKPAPDIFLATANKLNVFPSDCVVIEDSTNGVLAAIAAKMKCIGYINATSGNQDLSKADLTIDDFNKLDANQILNLH